MGKITFQCETITPMFLAGADGKTPELRPPSIKAAMRFWWRAMNGDLSLSDLKKDEAKIFGGSGENEGRSKFSIRIKNLKGATTSSKFPSRNVNASSKGKTFQINILEYLAYGTQEYKKGIGQLFIREYYPAGTTFEIEIVYDNSIQQLISFNDLIGLISQVGGLGSRSRNGFGRFTIKGNQFDFINFINNNINIKISRADFLVFNEEMKLFSLNSDYSSWDACLAELGKIYKSSREALENRHKFDLRQFIASPILENKRQVTILDRHTKPYFFVINKNNSKKYEGKILFLPYNYLKGYDNPPKKQETLLQDFNNATARFNELLSTKMGVLL